VYPFAGRPNKSRTATRLVSTALCLAVTISLPALAADKPNGSPIAAQTEALVLRVNLNTENKGDLFVQRSADLDFLLRVEDLKAMGFKDPTGTVQLIDGEPHLSLRSIRGVTATFDEKSLALNITADPTLLSTSVIGLRAERRRGTLAGSINSAFLNYALTATDGSVARGNGLGFAGEAGVRWGDYLFLSDAGTVSTTAGEKFTRLTSSVTRDDRENLRRIVVGDFLTWSRDFSSSVNLGGISVTKLYGIDPYFVRFPTQTLTGSVALPSDMEVYLDGQRIRTERLRPGEFELRDILAYGGARNVQVILRDAFGRVQQLNYSLYFTDQPLQKGLHEYSYNFGAIRRHYGIRSNSYGPAALTMFHRYGISNAVTLGWRAEATRELVNSGPTATLALGAFGVVNLGMAGSAIAGMRGAAQHASYNFESKNWTLGAFIRHDGREFASLADPPVMTNRRYEGTVSAGYRLPQNATVSVSHTALTTRAQAAATAAGVQPFTVVALGNRRVSALTYSMPLGSIKAQFTATLSRIKDGLGSRTEAFVGLNFLLGKDYSAAGSFRGDRQSHSESMRLTKNQPIGEGLGFDLSLDRFSAGDSTQFRSNIQYNAPAAVLRADYGQALNDGQRTHDQRVSVAGGIVAVGGHVALSRPVTQSYAIVKVGEVAGVGISVDGQPSGKTDTNGLAVIPNLNAYYETSVSIASSALPMDYSLPAEVKRVLPSPRSGALIDFGVTKTQAFSGKLLALDALPKPVEFAEIVVSVDGKLQKLATGHRGEFYVENLRPGTYKATVSLGTARCAFDLNIPESDQMFVDLGEVLCLPAR
jgi:outer membrane usher protein